MQIHGFNKTTLLDYPEHIAATVFTGGCNFRCPFCHNGELVLDPGCQPLIPEEEVLSYLKKRQGILQGVCVTGGEPTLQKDLKDFLRKIKELGYPIKLDTNGYMPGVLWDLMQEHLIDMWRWISRRPEIIMPGRRDCRIWISPASRRVSAS